MTTLQALAHRVGVTASTGAVVKLPIGRMAFPALCRVVGLSRGAEVGVWKGAYSQAWCQAGFTWTAVDPWAPYADYREKKNDAVLIDAAYDEAKRRLAPYPCELMRMSSREAAARVPDGSLDVVYVDGNHEAEFVREDIELWTPKIRRGGLLAGHDYRVPPASKPFIQVKAAVDAYVAERGIAPFAVMAGDATPSFCWEIA